MIGTAVLVEVAPSTGAGLVTAVATVITALGGLVLAIGVLIPILRNTRDTKAQVQSVHTIVNQQHTDQQRYIIALTEILRAQGIEVPVDQSLPVTGHPDAKPGQPQ